MTSASSASSPGTSTPASSVEMSRPAILQIGDLVHCQKEWAELGSFADLKVFPYSVSGIFLRLIFRCRNSKVLSQEQIF